MLLVGKVIGTHGLRGDFRVKPFSGDSSALFEVRRVYFRSDTGETVSRQPTKVRFLKGAVLMHLSNVDDIDSVQPLLGCDVLVDPVDLPELAEDEFYWFELEGIAVEDRSRGDLGKVVDLLTTGAHDIYVVNGPFGEVLIPAVEDFVVDVDLKNRRMEVDLPEGLVPGPDEL